MMLIGLSQKWYQRLPDSFIENFKELANSFKQKFTSCITPRKLSFDLIKIQQAEGESLRDYLSRFNAEAIQIENLNHETACEAMKKGSKNKRFVDSLIKNQTMDYEQLMERAKKYISLDDERRALKEKWHTGQSLERDMKKDVVIGKLMGQTPEPLNEIDTALTRL
ncbi:hypothetical protein P3X46_027862 [Hevea brasiliensis]|uniref:Retrotransposon gag domain-containing protein n=1 Tax=Hevea brasiliensis TaxID=3981 RepID=A0ABQ9L1A4_HEVBR|nr:hypothetical protein P3X46_027862 [Hevea brasiliensis]